jgi:hypothetical protein
MAAKEWLLKYGYVQGADGRYRRPGKRTQVWEEIPDGGWNRYEIEDGKEVQEVHSVAEEFQGVGGLHKNTHPDSFVWVYPDEYVENIYKTAAAEVAAPSVSVPPSE